jgi:YbbR domain-containing protein
MTTLRRWWDRLRHNGPSKLGALFVALFIWTVVATDETTTAQRSLLVPLVVEGLEADRVAVGLPEFVEITVSGVSSRVDRLRPESFDAVLDLTSVVGTFQLDVSVAPPQGIRLERVVPSEVIGELEPVTSVEVPVRVSVAGALGPDERLAADATPAVARVRGRAAVVAQVAAVVAPVAAEQARTDASAAVVPFAVDATGRPVLDVAITPEQVTVAMAVEAVRVERRLPLRVASVVASGWSQVEDAPADVRVTGSASALAALEAIDATVDLPTEPPAPGRYTRPLDLALPDGVFALEAPTASLRYAPIPLPE